MTVETAHLDPFVGPRPFLAAERDVFFGRDAEIAQLTSLVIAHPAVLLYAVSGAGKSSLLSAGLALTLAEQGFEVFPRLRLRAPIDPPANARNAYMYSALWGLPGRDRSDDAGKDAPDEKATLADSLAALPRGTDPYGFESPRLLIFDQFEELFTLHQDRWQEREGFFEQVRRALVEDPSLRVLFALREEYLARLDRYGPLLPDGLSSRFHLERLRRDAAILAVKGPLERAGVSIDEEVAETLVADLEQTRVDTGRGRTVTVPGEFVEPVHLQVVCRRLWSRLDRAVNEVTREDLAGLGTVDESLTLYYDEAVTAAVPKGRRRQRRFRDAFERAFITSAGTRATIFADGREKAPLSAAALDELALRHVIRGEWRAGGRWLELAHDRLIEPVARSNAKVRRRFRRRRLVLGTTGAVMAASLIGGCLALVAEERFGDSGRLLGAVPGASKPCVRTPADGAWMVSDLGAEEQVECLPAAIRGRDASDEGPDEAEAPTDPSVAPPEDVSGGSLTYGLFSNATKARNKLDESTSHELRISDTKVCAQRAQRQLRRRFRDGAVYCLMVDHRRTVEIAWNADGSPVMGVVTFDRPTSDDAAVAAWRHVLGR